MKKNSKTYSQYDGFGVINFSNIKDMARFREISSLYYSKLLTFKPVKYIALDYDSNLTIAEIESKIINSEEYKQKYVIRQKIKKIIASRISHTTTYIGSNCFPGFINRIILNKESSDTPTVDVKIELVDFVQLSKMPDYYLAAKPVFNRRLSNLKGYIVMQLHDIQIHHIHKGLRDWNKVRDLWVKRLNKINWDNMHFILDINKLAWQDGNRTQLLELTDDFLNNTKYKTMIMTDSPEFKKMFLNNESIVLVESFWNLEDYEKVLNQFIDAI